MRRILLVLTLAVAALAAPQFDPLYKDYHEEFGIAHYEAIKAYEDALDFDGSRIAGGSHAWLGQYPFMGGVVIHLPNRDSVCGSSLLSHTRSVTAAHCWRHGGSVARSFTLVFGSIRLSTGGTRIHTNQVDMHPQYNQHNLNNDIAVVRHNHVHYNAHVNRINLASGNNLFVGTQANVIGFGQITDGAPIPHNQPLSHTRVAVITNAECSRRFSAGVVIASTMCTSGAGNRGPCVGDSGGPLAVGNTLIGVVSFNSSGGCSRGYPAAYQRVTSFNAWIRSRM